MSAVFARIVCVKCRILLKTSHRLNAFVISKCLQWLVLVIMFKNWPVHRESAIRASAHMILLCDSDAFNHFDGGHRSVVGVNATASIFVTFPQPYLTTFSGFIDEVTFPYLYLTCGRA